MSLRPYQARAVEWTERTLAALLAAGRRRSVVLQAPTGAGKSRIAAALEPDLVIAPGVDLARQLAGTIPGAAVHTAQALSRLLDRGADLPPARRVVIDEARWIVAKSWARIPAWYLEHGAELVLLDATPATATGQGLGSVAEELYQVSSMRELQEAGYLVPFRFFGPSEELGAMAAPRGEKCTAAEAPALWHRMYEEAGWIRPGARSIWFGDDAAHAAGIVAAFSRAGIPAEQIGHKTPRRRRAELLGSPGERGLLARGELRVLACPELLRQGIDVPEVEVIGLARRVGSYPLRQQAVGRGGRPCPSIGKTECIVFDLYGTCRRPGMGLPDDPKIWSLEGQAVRPALEPLPPCIECRKCLGYSRSNPCEFCGAVKPPPPPPRVRAADLIEVRALESDEAKAEALARYVRDAYERARQQGKTGPVAEKSAWSGVFKWASVYGSKPSGRVAKEAIRAAVREYESPAQQAIPGA